MSELVEFIRGCLDADEQTAREALALSSVYEQPTVKWHWIVAHEGGTRWHPTRHDPARVLAEVAAKRAIVEAYRAQQPGSYTPGYEGRKSDITFGQSVGLEHAVRALASVYEGAPGWQEEWR